MKTFVQYFTLLLFLLVNTESQGQAKKPKKKAKAKPTAAVQKFNPEWALKYGYTGKEPIYFPDYYAFYDPKRGYVFWNMQQNSWSTSLQPPSFMTNVYQPKTRIQILKGLSLDLHPERNYPNYMKLYPAKTSYPDVPVPNEKQGYK
jgi:hypothetical protein